MKKVIPRQILFGINAGDKIIAGISKTAKAVSSTLGPKGKNVLIKNPNVKGGYQFTKDGISVAKSIFLEDHFENMGAEIAKEAGNRSVNVAGDGTTTTITLLDAIVTRGHQLVGMKHDQMSIRRGIDAAAKWGSDWVRKHSTPITTTEDLHKVALISANSDVKIATDISTTLDRIGHDATVLIEESKGAHETVVKISKGFEFDRGYTNAYFSNDARMRVVFNEQFKVFTDLTKEAGVYIWVVNGRMSALTQGLADALNQIHSLGAPFIIIAEAVEGEMLQFLLENKMNGKLRCAAVKAPGFGADRREMLEDLAVLTGATIRYPETGQSLFEDFSPTELGIARSVEVYAEKTIIVPTDFFAEAVDERISKIDSQLAQAEDFDVKHSLTRRKSIMTGGIATIMVGGRSEAETRERRDLYEDALLATRAAAESGIVPGAGTTLLRLSEALKDFTTGDSKQDIGVMIFREALKVPFMSIIQNGGGPDQVILSKVLESNDFNWGFDSAKEEYCDLIERGIIDPVKVVTSEIDHATSVAGLVLSTDVVISYPDPQE